MTIKELALAACALVLILGLSVASNALLDRYLPMASAEIAATAPTGGACVDAKGSWVNWPWANVPALSPPCAANTSRPAQEK